MLYVASWVLSPLATCLGASPATCGNERKTYEIRYLYDYLDIRCFLLRPRHGASHSHATAQTMIAVLFCLVLPLLFVLCLMLLWEN